MFIVFVYKSVLSRLFLMTMLFIDNKQAKSLGRAI